MLILTDKCTIYCLILRSNCKLSAMVYANKDMGLSKTYGVIEHAIIGQLLNQKCPILRDDSSAADKQLHNNTIQKRKAERL